MAFDDEGRRVRGRAGRVSEGAGRVSLTAIVYDAAEDARQLGEVEVAGATEGEVFSKVRQRNLESPDKSWVFRDRDVRRRYEAWLDRNPGKGLMESSRADNRKVTLTIGQLRRVVAEAIQGIVAGEPQPVVEPSPRANASRFSRDVSRRYQDCQCCRTDHWARAIVEETSDGSETLVFQGAEVARCAGGKCEALPGWDASPASVRVVSEFMASHGAKAPRRARKG